MSYEAFREQCANIICKSENKFVAEARINALPLPDDMPLPEVNYETAKKEFEKWIVNQGVAMDYRGDGIYGNPTVRRWHEGFIAATELGFCGNANTEALRKENEQLRERITEIERISYSARCALQADVNDRDEVIANCSDKIRILESKLAALKGGTA